MDTDSEETASHAPSLLDAFSFPVVTTSQINQESINRNDVIESSIFSVAPSLEYMSKAVLGLLKRLNWSTATLVISDQVPPVYSSIFEQIAKRVSFNVIASNTIRMKSARSLRRRHSQEFSMPVSIFSCKAVPTESHLSLPFNKTYRQL